ncbi:MAG: hydroxyphenylacetyl-CoA thioesterase PaaI [Acidimicrobiales bacterium]
MIDHPPVAAGPPSSPSPVNPDDVTAAMYANDRAATALGIVVRSTETDRAVVELTVRADMVNGLDVCHGGIIFTLADSAMAYVSNAANERAVAAQADIDWVRPARLGDVLTATALTVHRQGRAAVHDVTVVNADGEIVALFRGRTRLVGGHHVPG